MEIPCYAETGNSGWCGTCLNAAKVTTSAAAVTVVLILLKPGEPGYCKPGKPEGALKEAEKEEEEEGDDSEYPRPSVWGGWGFCDALCTQTNYQVDMTQQQSSTKLGNRR